MSTNSKGDLGVLKVGIDLINKGYEIFPAFSSSSPVDMLAMKADKIVRLQIKHKKVTKGVVQVCNYTIHSRKAIPYDLSTFDYFAVYVPEREVVFYIPSTELKDMQSYSVRFDEPVRHKHAEYRKYTEFLEMR